MNAELPLSHLAAPHESPAMAPISAVDALNRACFCFSLDQDALARALDSELGQPGLSVMVRERCPYLFAAQPVFVAATQLQQIGRAHV